MSTNYYLINRKDAEIKHSLTDLIELKIEGFKENLISFGKENNLSDFEEDVEEKFNTISSELDYGLFEPEEIHICRYRKNALTWQITEYWNDEESFIKFYMDNVDKYRIENEYKEEFALNNFLPEIHFRIDITEYLHCDFS